MNNIFTYNGAFNSLSFGQISTAIVKEAFRQKIDCNIFPIGNQIDLSVFKPEQEFGMWLQNSVINSQKRHNRKN